jgi:hypothetical protein
VSACGGGELAVNVIELAVLCVCHLISTWTGVAVYEILRNVPAAVIAGILGFLLLPSLPLYLGWLSGSKSGPMFAPSGFVFFLMVVGPPVCVGQLTYARWGGGWKAFLVEVACQAGVLVVMGAVSSVRRRRGARSSAQIGKVDHPHGMG